jgi:hypothetical protein
MLCGRGSILLYVEGLQWPKEAAAVSGGGGNKKMEDGSLGLFSRCKRVGSVPVTIRRGISRQKIK